MEATDRFILKALSPRFMNQNTHEITIPKQHSNSIEDEPTSQSNKKNKEKTAELLVRNKRNYVKFITYLSEKTHE